MTRLDEDREKLHEAVGFYRTRANLHGASSDASLVRWAHHGGKGKPHADMVREKWHDFVQGRLASNLPVSDYQIEYAQAGLFEGPPPSADAGAPSPSRDDGSVTKTDEVGDRSGEERAEPSSVQTGDPHVPLSPEEIDQVKRAGGVDPFCGHKVVNNDGHTVACDKCGEVLGEVVTDDDGEHVEWKDGHAYEVESSRTEEIRPAALNEPEKTDPAPQRASKPAEKPEPTDDDTVLF